jgi:HD-like signal output (HDOD) protein
MVISSNEKTSLSQFANVILKNVSLTAQLLRLVNTVYFSYQRTPIYSISHAIVILGWDTIRDTAASLMLLADFGKKSETVRDLLLLSVLTANSAMEVATRCKYPRK